MGDCATVAELFRAVEAQDDAELAQLQRRPLMGYLEPSAAAGYAFVLHGASGGANLPSVWLSWTHVSLDMRARDVIIAAWQWVCAEPSVRGPSKGYVEVLGRVALARPADVPRSRPPDAPAPTLSELEHELSRSRKQSGKGERYAVCAVLVARSPVCRWGRDGPGGTDAFFAELQQPDGSLSTCVLFHGEQACLWHPFLIVGRAYELRSLRNKVLFHGTPDERTMLVADAQACVADFDELPLGEPDFAAVIAPRSAACALARAPATETVAASALDQARHGDPMRARAAAHRHSPVTYTGLVSECNATRMCILLDDGAVELDVSDCPLSGGAGLGIRPGARVTCYHVHPIYFRRRLAGLAACRYSQIRVVQHGPSGSWVELRCPDAVAASHMRRFTPSDRQWLREIQAGLAHKFASLFRPHHIYGFRRSDGSLDYGLGRFVAETARGVALPSYENDFVRLFVSHAQRCRLFLCNNARYKKLVSVRDMLDAGRTAIGEAASASVELTNWLVLGQLTAMPSGGSGELRLVDDTGQLSLVTESGALEACELQHVWHVRSGRLACERLGDGSVRCVLVSRREDLSPLLLCKDCPIVFVTALVDGVHGEPALVPGEFGVRGREGEVQSFDGLRFGLASSVRLFEWDWETLAQASIETLAALLPRGPWLVLQVGHVHAPMRGSSCVRADCLLVCDGSGDSAFTGIGDTCVGEREGGDHLAGATCATASARCHVLASFDRAMVRYALCIPRGGLMLILNCTLRCTAPLAARVCSIDVTSHMMCINLRASAGADAGTGDLIENVREVLCCTLPTDVYARFAESYQDLRSVRARVLSWSPREATRGGLGAAGAICVILADVRSAVHTIALYVDVEAFGHGAAWQPEAVVVLHRVLRRVSLARNLYLQFAACTQLVLERTPLSSAPVPAPATGAPLASEGPPSQLAWLLRSESIVRTVLRYECHLVALFRVDMEWRCMRCGLIIIWRDGYLAEEATELLVECCVCPAPASKFLIEVSAAVEDGTAEAFLSAHADAAWALLGFPGYMISAAESLSRARGALQFSRLTETGSGSGGGLLQLTRATIGSTARTGSRLDGILQALNSPRTLRPVVLEASHRARRQGDGAGEGEFDVVARAGAGLAGEEDERAGETGTRRVLFIDRTRRETRAPPRLHLQAVTVRPMSALNTCLRLLRDLSAA